MTTSSVAAREHAGVAGLIAAAWRQKSATLFATLFSRGGALGLGKALGTPVGGDDGGEVGELLGLKGEKLIAGLCRLQGARRALALAGLPRDYAGVPRLGPPLPGDLGRPSLGEL